MFTTKYSIQVQGTSADLYRNDDYLTADAFQTHYDEVIANPDYAGCYVSVQVHEANFTMTLFATHL